MTRKCESMNKENKNLPYVVCHMLTSLDGKIDGEYMHTPECVLALQEYAKIRESYHCKATIYGTTTMVTTYADGYIKELNDILDEYPREDYIVMNDAESYVISIDLHGELAFHSKYIEKKNRPKAHIVEVLSKNVSDAYLAYLRDLEISYIFVGVGDQLDCHLLLKKLFEIFSIDRLMVAGGGYMNYSFAQENLIDELSIIIAPVTDGNTTSVSIFEKGNFLPSKSPISFALKDMNAINQNVVWLRYMKY